MSLRPRATVLHMMAVVVCAAGTCFSTTGVGPGPGGPDCRSTAPGDSEPNVAFYSNLVKARVTSTPNTADGRMTFFWSPLSVYPPWPEAMVDARLTEPQAVPYLIGVLLKGPNWPIEGRSAQSVEAHDYYARCYAALCLGLSKDGRAFGPLLDILQDTTIEPFTTAHPVRKDTYDLRDFAAFALGDLGDCRAIEPLHAALRNDHFARSIYSLLKLNAFSKVPSIIESAVEYDLLYSHSVHASLAYALKIQFTVQRSRESETWTVAEFPELVGDSVTDIYGKLWLHWLEVGDRRARECFDTWYPQWKAAVRDRPEDVSLQRALLVKMLKGGVAMIPYVIDTMKQGDERLAEAMRSLARDGNDEERTADQWLQWWRDHRRQWQVFDTTSVTRILRVPDGYSTIQSAIDDANDGDLVVVGPGAYTEAVRMKAGVDLAGSGAAETILTAERTNAVVHGADHCRLDGFTISGHIYEDIDGVYCEDVNDFTISNNIIRNCTWSGVNGVRSTVEIRNNVICGSRCAGVFLSYPAADRSTVVNNTIWNNANEADVTIWRGANALVVNNIMEDIDCDETSEAEIRYNNIVSQAVDANNIQADPLFADAAAGDFHLLSRAGRWDPIGRDWIEDCVTSPCIDAGDPTSPIGHEPAPHGGRVNLGAYGGTAEAGKSYIDP